jgi:hypothetical protein
MESNRLQSFINISFINSHDKELNAISRTTYVFLLETLYVGSWTTKLFTMVKQTQMSCISMVVMLLVLNMLKIGF